jgi:hypothetical protein
MHDRSSSTNPRVLYLNSPCVCVAPWAVVSCMRALGVPSIPELIYLRNLEVLNLDGNRLECAFPRRSSCSTLPVNNWSR